MKAAVIPVLAVAVLAGCQTSTTTQAPTLQPISVAMQKETRPIAFQKVVVRIPRNQPIGSIQGGALCIKNSDLTPRGGRYQIDADMLTDVFRDELEAHGYKVVGNPNALFDDPTLAEAEYLIGSLIADNEANICYPLIGFGDFNTQSAAVYIKSNWQLYSTLDRKVVFETDTEGSYQTQGTSENADMAFENAFAQATLNLLANTGFYNFLAGVAPSSVSAPLDLNLTGVKFDTSQEFDAAAARASVVTVRSAIGHGSGFILTEDGYILTNEHVVSAASNVRIILHTGREVVGEVIATEPKRDIAVIKIANEGFIPVSVARSEPPIGADVYAVGAPLEEDLSGTVSKGIVSSYRVQDGNRFILK